ncbi:hypothetical protein RhiJN_13668 [Ceratobasidium sp. AG-Ba]|nr:hypothetical protein RhiJN_13668 [Ceratobasidium sp. AG-Ba]QRW07833.1 hypothetical protein RhiLY_06832 [Ceratobasidium sp. AG-Ba]QRW14224.1 hypothetical protein RhiLY_13223 [Ceratobasidium sp. AG-Ba]
MTGHKTTTTTSPALPARQRQSSLRKKSANDDRRSSNPPFSAQMSGPPTLSMTLWMGESGTEARRSCSTRPRILGPIPATREANHDTIAFSSSSSGPPLVYRSAQLSPVIVEDHCWKTTCYCPHEIILRRRSEAIHPHHAMTHPPPEMSPNPDTTPTTPHRNTRIQQRAGARSLQLSSIYTNITDPLRTPAVARLPQASHIQSLVEKFWTAPFAGVQRVRLLMGTWISGNAPPVMPSSRTFDGLGRSCGHARRETFPSSLAPGLRYDPTRFDQPPTTPSTRCDPARFDAASPVIARFDPARPDSCPTTPSLARYDASPVVSRFNTSPLPPDTTLLPFLMPLPLSPDTIPLRLSHDEPVRIRASDPYTDTETDKDTDAPSSPLSEDETANEAGWTSRGKVAETSSHPFPFSKPPPSQGSNPRSGPSPT